jgi:hypothetical protein
VKKAFKHIYIYIYHFFSCWFLEWQ